MQTMFFFLIPNNDDDRCDDIIKHRSNIDYCNLIIVETTVSVSR